MLFLRAAAALLSLAGPALAAFGVTGSSGNFVVDTAGGLVFTVGAGGDITSILYNGKQCQDSSKFSHIASGLGATNIVATTVSSTTLKITVTTDTLTHYYIAKSGDPTIYMGTYVTAEPSVGELRFIARLLKTALPTAMNTGAEVNGGTAIEGSDVFLLNGSTRSKFYSSKRFIDDPIHCVTGSSIAACMAIGNYESSSGGPFFRDIDNQGSAQQELYFYMNSGHVQTESYRMGFHGPYALMFTAGSTPAVPDFSFYSGLSLSGYVPQASRGRVSGTVSGITTSNGVVHWYNSAAQYWVASSGSFTSPYMKPGTYQMVLYKGELKVATSTVTVTAGGTATANIANGEVVPASVVFRLGTRDGSPSGFKNAANQLLMHPSDSRMSAWAASTFTVGSSSTADFPMAQIKTVNDPTTIAFTLTSSQASSARTLRISTTLSFAGGRPSVVVNSYSPATPAAPVKIDSRGFTRGAYRGYGEVYEFAIPASAFVTGSNTIAISVASGSSGTTFLNPNFIYDMEVERVEERGRVKDGNGGGACGIAACGVHATGATFPTPQGRLQACEFSRVTSLNDQ
ncbi:putative rhamnogalacturonate lyase A [Geopyxis carbonaria]|nr:putative rhamnogalacturonate lyase A [Geopyxis carbonaria]